VPSKGSVYHNEHECRNRPLFSEKTFTLIKVVFRPVGPMPGTDFLDTATPVRPGPGRGKVPACVVREVHVVSWLSLVHVSWGPGVPRLCPFRPWSAPVLLPPGPNIPSRSADRTLLLRRWISCCGAETRMLCCLNCLQIGKESSLVTLWLAPGSLRNSILWNHIAKLS
jgi:hypothetical protein